MMKLEEIKEQKKPNLKEELSTKMARLRQESQGKLAKLVDKGIPVWKAEFHSAVNNSDGVPETFFSLESNRRERVVEMWWVSGDGLLCLHKDKYFLIPGATAKDCRFF